MNGCCQLLLAVSHNQLTSGERASDIIFQALVVRHNITRAADTVSFSYFTYRREALSSLCVK
jgi:hypothetical protein